jgi:hypothetical protein
MRWAAGRSRDCVRTLKKLSAIRERIDEVFDTLRAIEELSEREEARMSTVINLLPIGRPSVEILIEYLEDDDWLVREAAAICWERSAMCAQSNP